MAESQLSRDAPAIVFHQRPSGPGGKYAVEKLRGLLETFAAKLQKRSPVRTIEIFLGQAKNRVGKVVTFRAMLHVHLASGKRYVAASEQYIARAKHVGLEACIREAIKEITEQIRRGRASKK